MSPSEIPTTDGFTVCPAGGQPFLLALPDSGEPNVRTIRSGTYPPSLQKLFTALASTTPAPARVLDLGGYMGAFGLAAAAAGYEVAIIEANPDNARWIRKSISLNRFPHPVKLVETAVGQTEGWVGFHAEGPYGHVQQDDLESGIRVRQTTLPLLMGEIDWDSPDFIKMDVEGSECGVLRGALDWFAQGHRPTFLYEANGHTLHWFGDSPAVLRSILRAAGYHQYEVEPDGKARTPTAFEPRVVVDYIASAKPLPSLPRSPAWKVARRTLVALRRNSQPGRLHVLRVLRGLLVPNRQSKPI
jgi:FkbM family methyltransferase